MGNTLVTTPFGATSTAAEVIEGVDLAGKRAIVTGGSSGIGLETARALASAGAEVTLAVRNVESGRVAAEDIAATTGSTRVLVEHLDVADQSSIAAFLARWGGPLHILVNNAGIMASPELRTAEGWELQFATNHLGHFALTNGLHEALAAANGARVVAVSSVGHLNGEVLFDDINFERHAYDPWAAYSQSKTANVLFAVQAAKLWATDKIAVNALTPGRIRTGLMRYLVDQPAAPASFQADNSAIVYKTPEQGAATSTLLAASPLLEGVSGRYFADCNEAAPQEPGIRLGVAAYAVDAANAERLWAASTELLANGTATD
jgi:NAD(P)-dependent dehydrogenase (short-subunit alcohol dehydrogenase family)